MGVAEAVEAPKDPSQACQQNIYGHTSSFRMQVAFFVWKNSNHYVNALVNECLPIFVALEPCLKVFEELI